MSNTKKNQENQQETLETAQIISNLALQKGQTVSSMITLVIPPKYCI